LVLEEASGSCGGVSLCLVGRKSISKMSNMDEATRLYYVRRTIVQMVVDRGYLVTQKLKDETLEAFKQDFESHLNKREQFPFLFRKKDDLTDQLFVFFPEDLKVGVKPIRSYCEKMKEQSVQRAIIVVIQGMSAFARQALAEMAPKYKLEHFTETELLVNITEHQLVPKHIKLTPAEKKQLLERYKLKDSQLPRIQMNDPVARYYGLERGEVVKIIRPSETAGRYVTYRLVC